MSDKAKTIRLGWVLIFVGILLGTITAIIVSSPLSWVFLMVQITCVIVAAGCVFIMRRAS